LYFIALHHIFHLVTFNIVYSCMQPVLTKSDLCNWVIHFITLIKITMTRSLSKCSTRYKIIFKYVSFVNSHLYIYQKTPIVWSLLYGVSFVTFIIPKICVYICNIPFLQHVPFDDRLPVPINLPFSIKNAF